MTFKYLKREQRQRKKLLREYIMETRFHRIIIYNLYILLYIIINRLYIINNTYKTYVKSQVM